MLAESHCLDGRQGEKRLEQRFPGILGQHTRTSLRKNDLGVCVDRQSVKNEIYVVEDVCYKRQW